MAAHDQQFGHIQLQTGSASAESFDGSYFGYHTFDDYDDEEIDFDSSALSIGSSAINDQYFYEVVENEENTTASEENDATLSSGILIFSQVFCV